MEIIWKLLRYLSFYCTKKVQYCAQDQTRGLAVFNGALRKRRVCGPGATRTNATQRRLRLGRVVSAHLVGPCDGAEVASIRSRANFRCSHCVQSNRILYSPGCEALWDSFIPQCSITAVLSFHFLIIFKGLSDWCRRTKKQWEVTMSAGSLNSELQIKTTYCTHVGRKRSTSIDLSL